MRGNSNEDQIFQSVDIEINNDNFPIVIELYHFPLSSHKFTMKASRTSFLFWRIIVLLVMLLIMKEYQLHQVLGQPVDDDDNYDDDTYSYDDDMNNATEANQDCYTNWTELSLDIKSSEGGTKQSPEVFEICEKEVIEVEDDEDLLIIASPKKFITIQCTDCIVTNAAMKIGGGVRGITLIGITFVEQAGEVYIGKGAQVNITDCLFRDTLFAGTSEKRAALVSAGYLMIFQSRFTNNLGLGALHVVGGATYVEKSQFLYNAASDWLIASAVVVGAKPNDDKKKNTTSSSLAVLSVRQSCFENNKGEHVIYEYPNGDVTMNSQNAVQNEHGGATCPGISNGTDANICEPFDIPNTRCADFMARSFNTVAPTGRVPTVKAPTIPSPTIGSVLTFPPTRSPQTIADGTTPISKNHNNNTNSTSESSTLLTLPPSKEEKVINPPELFDPSRAWNDPRKDPGTPASAVSSSETFQKDTTSAGNDPWTGRWIGLTIYVTMAWVWTLF
jgi:hypothetical protein